MHDTGRGEEHETVEDAAASVLAAAFGYGSTWHAAEVRHGAGERDEAGTPMRWHRDALAIRRQGPVLEQAGRYLPANADNWPRWATRQPPGELSTVKAWSDANPLQTRRGDVGEYEKWNRIWTEVSVPEVRMDGRALGALHDAGLTPPQAAMLRVFAIEDRSAAESVIRHAVASGHQREIALNALVYRVMFPSARRLHHSLKRRAWELGMRESAYRTAENAAADLLRAWLHEASVKFMHAHGRVKRTFIPSVALRSAAPKRSRPRFAKGWDSRQRPGPVVIVALHGGRVRTPAKAGSSEGETPARVEPSRRVA